MIPESPAKKLLCLTEVALLLLSSAVSIGAQQTHTVPFTAEALEFYDYYDIDTPRDLGNCPTGTSVDAKFAVGTNCNSECYVGWTRAGEWLEYQFDMVPINEGFDKITVRASSERPKTIRLSLDGKQIGDDFVLPGNGWANFLDLSVNGVEILGGALHRLRVDFLTGRVNLCSVSVDYDCPSETDCFKCFEREPCTWAKARNQCMDKTACSNTDDCLITGDGRNQCPVDCSGIQDCEACVDKQGCGWVPNLGTCEACEFTERPLPAEWEPCWYARWDKGACESEFCYRFDTCTDCLETDDCSWHYSGRGVECLILPKSGTCGPPYMDCFTPIDVVESGLSTMGFCQDLEDPTCAERMSCGECLKDNRCGWIHRDEQSPTCMPKSKCGTNCFTSDDFGSLATPGAFCEALIASFDTDKDLCSKAKSCGECYTVQPVFFDSCMWLKNSVNEEGDWYSNEYCALECFDSGYYSCEDLGPERCPSG